MKLEHLDAVYGLGRLIAGHGDITLDWRDPRLLGRSNLLATAVWPALDDETRSRFAEPLEGFAVAHALNTDRNAALLAQLERIVARLNTAGIEPVVFKGAAHLATSLWPTPGSRLISDIDLLIEPQDIERAFSVLEDFAGEGPQERGHPEVVALHKHMMPVLGAGGPAAVELHHSVYWGAAARLAPADALRDRAHRLDLGTARALILSPTDRVVTAMFHSLAGSGTYLVPTLHMRDMLDIHFLARAHGDEIDWGRIADDVSAAGWEPALEITNRCLDRFTGMTPPFSGAGLRSRIDAARWIWQMEHQNPVLRQAGLAANHLLYTLRSVRAGGEPRRQVLVKLVQPDTYRVILRRYLLGQET